MDEEGDVYVGRTTFFQRRAAQHRHESNMEMIATWEGTGHGTPQSERELIAFFRMQAVEEDFNVRNIK